MEINSHFNIGSVGRLSPDKAVQRESKIPRDQINLNQTDEINSALEQAPDVRQDVVVRGKQLVGQVNYPPPETIQKLSLLLGMKLDSSE